MIEFGTKTSEKGEEVEEMHPHTSVKLKCSAKYTYVGWMRKF